MPLYRFIGHDGDAKTGQKPVSKFVMGERDAKGEPTGKTVTIERGGTVELSEEEAAGHPGLFELASGKGKSKLFVSDTTQKADD